MCSKKCQEEHAAAVREAGGFAKYFVRACWDTFALLWKCDCNTPEKQAEIMALAHQYAEERKQPVKTIVARKREERERMS